MIERNQRSCVHAAWNESVDMTTTKLCNPCFWMSDLNSSSLIQGGRPNHGLPDALRFELVESPPEGRKRSLSVELVAPGLFGRRPKGGGPRRSVLVPPAGSRLGITIIGRLLSPSCTTFVPKSTGFTKVTLRASHRSTLCGVPLVSKSTGAPAEATTSPATFSNATDFNSPVLTSSLSADSRRSCDTNRR